MNYLLPSVILKTAMLYSEGLVKDEKINQLNIIANLLDKQIENETKVYSQTINMAKKEIISCIERFWDKVRLEQIDFECDFSVGTRLKNLYDNAQNKASKKELEKILFTHLNKMIDKYSKAMSIKDFKKASDRIQKMVNLS